MLSEIWNSQRRLFEVALLLLTTTMVVGSAQAQTYRAPRIGNPAFQLKMREGWKLIFNDSHGNLVINLLDGGASVQLATLDKSNDTSTAAEIAATLMTWEGFSPCKPAGTGMIDGRPGDAFESTVNQGGSGSLNWRLIVTQLDPRHFASLGVIKGPLTPSQEKEVAAMVAQIHLVGQEPAAALAKGRAAYDRRDYDLAMAGFNEAIRLDPNNAEAFELRGRCSNHQHNFTQALADFTQAIALEPDRAVVYSLRGVILALKHDYAAAVADYNQSLRLDPEMAGTYALRGAAFSDQHDWARANADFNEALSLNPKSSGVYYFRAWMHVKQSAYALALADFNRAMLLSPEIAGAYNGAAWLLATAPDEKVRDGARAMELATKACQLSEWKEPKHIDTLAAAYAEAGKFAEATKWEREFLSSGPTAETATAARARLRLYQLGKPYRDSQPSF